jgi:dCTP deaminase
MPLVDYEISNAVYFDPEHPMIEPYREEQLQPASYDLRLGPEVRVPRPDVKKINFFDSRWPHEYTDKQPTGGTVIEPRGFLLGTTMETIELPGNMIARVEGKSSLARVGLGVHVTAGYIDPGFRGQITLEIVNLAPWSIELAQGMRIGQIVFERTRTAPDRDYSITGRYQGQDGVTESRYTPGG